MHAPAYRRQGQPRAATEATVSIASDWFYPELQHYRHKWQKFVTSCYVVGGRMTTLFVDETGVPYGIKQIDGKPRVSSMPYLYDIAEGNVPDHSPVRAFGYNGNVPITWETVHVASTLRHYLTAAEQLQVASTDADDDGAPLGNGARTIVISGLDTNYEALNEVVTMNGLVNVTTAASFLRVQSVTVMTAGTTGYNEGVITVSNNADTIVMDQIEVQENATLSAAYTVPADNTAYVTQAMATESSSKGCQFGFWIRPFGGLWIMKRSIVLLDSSIVLSMTMPMKLPAKTDIEIRAQAIQAGAIVTAGFEGWIETN